MNHVLSREMLALSEPLRRAPGRNLVKLAEHIDLSALRAFAEACSRSRAWIPVTAEYLRGYHRIPFRWAIDIDSLDARDDGYPSQIAAEHPEVASLLPAAVDQIRACCRRLHARELGAVSLMQLEPHGHLEPHVDRGLYNAWYARFHFVVKSTPESILMSGEQSCHMCDGELWWVNQSVEHEARNASGATDRIHLCVDALVPGFCGQLRSSLRSQRPPGSRL